MTNLFYSLAIDDILIKIQNGNFFYGRFNDGELKSVAKHKGKNCDAHEYFSDMGKQLHHILLNYSKQDNYIISTSKKFYNKLDWYKSVLIKLHSVNTNLQFNDFDMHYIFMKDLTYFFNLLNFLKTKNIVIVGPKYLKDLTIINNFLHIEVPLKNCFLEKNNIINDIKRIISTDKTYYFFISASMLSEIIIDNFYQLGDTKNSFIDFGSLWDYFFQSDKYSFIYHRSGISNLNLKHKKTLSKYIL